MKKQIILAVGLLLSQISCLYSSVDAISHDAFIKKLSKIAERKKVKVEKHENLTPEEKQKILDGVLENIFDPKHKDNFKTHADFVAMLFKGEKRKQYKEMVEILQKNRDCKSSIMFMCSVLSKLNNKAPKEVVDKVKALVDEHGGALAVKPILESKLK